MNTYYYTGTGLKEHRVLQTTRLILILLIMMLTPTFHLHSQTNGVFREVYTGITGSAVSDLTNNPAFPDSPTSENVETNFFEAPTNIMDNYGQRMRALLLAPTSGAYTFWIASDDNSSLFLSTDSTPANKQQIASVPGWTSSRQWSNYPQQQSAPITLVAGQRYYIEALMKEGGGGDNLAVTWQKPGDAVPANGANPIPATYLTPYGMGPPQITQQPTNLTAVEGGAATFSVQVSRPFAATFQWSRDGVSLLGATGSSYTLSPVALSDANSQFSCYIQNPYGSTNSGSAILNVTPDVTPPTLVVVNNVGMTNLWVTFSEPVEVASGTTVSNYIINGGVSIASAAFGSDTRTVVLTTSPLTFSASYTLTVSNVRDRARTPNTIAANSQVSFTALAYSPLDIGNPALGGSVSASTNGFNVAGTGSDIGGTTDQLQFAFQQRTGNFDVKARVQSLDQVNPWTKAGLMARATMDTDSVFAAALTTPSIIGSFFESRVSTGAVAAQSGSLSVNYPYTWLRLQRNGTSFTGFAGYDGQTWIQLGSASITMPATVFFGLAVSSHDVNRPASAGFADVSDVVSANIGPVSQPGEPIGPSSRKTGLVISEIMYKPAPRTDGRNLEFVELFNSNPFYEDISGYQISGSINFTFPSGTLMSGGAFLVVARVPADIQAVYGISNVTGPYTNSLKKTGIVSLLNDTGAVYLEVPYANTPPWPVAADGTGHSLVLARPSLGEADPTAWSISDVVGGSPGTVEAYRPSPLRSVVINEFLAHTDPPLYDYIELYNHSNQPVDVSGCTLSDHPTTNIFVIPAGTLIPPRGFVWFDENQMGFRLSAAGETIYFKNPDASRVLDAISFEGQQNSVSMGRFPDGADDFYPLTVRSPGSANGPIFVRDIVINEIMYKPISGNSDDQYVELYNQGTNAVNIGGWRFISGINYQFPTNTVLETNSYLVVARSATNLFARYANLNTNNTVGNFGGNLSGNGERLALAMPDQQVNTNTPGVLTTNIAWIVMDEVTYGTGGRWGRWADGGGSSLELIDPRSNHRLAYNWADSDETGKSVWTNIEATGTLDLGANYDPSIDRIQIGLLDAGECLIDAVEVRPGTNGANYATNPDFESGLTGWALQGDHYLSSLESTGYLSAHSLHVRCTDRIWTGANSVQGTLNNTSLAAGQQATLRFKARWLRGWPEALIRLNGNWLEATGTLPVPANLGTPGAPNSRAVNNAGPAFYGVTHSPALPAANQSVVVMAQVHDPDTVQSVTLRYRVDPSAAYTTLAMNDSGTGGDIVAGDGIYSATIPGKAANTIVAFYIQASDPFGATTRFPALLDDNSLPRESVIMFGDSAPAGGFGTYHLWLTQTNISLWSGLPDLSNQMFDGTFVYGNRVIYNMQARYAGSPYHQQFDTPNGSLCHYKWVFPDDDKFLGATSFNKIHQPGNGPGDDDTVQREQTAYWMVRQLGLPWNYRRFVAVYVNGNRRGTLMEDAQTPDADVVKEQFPNDADGFLYKLQPWFEFDQNGQGFNNNSWCTLNNYTSGGVKKLARYRWNYLCRRTPDSANNYTNVFALVDAANTYGTSDYVANMEAQVDMEEWLRIFAVEHSVGNWDSFGAQNAQNMYGYKPVNGKWTLFIWDYNIVLGNSGSWGPDGGNLFSYNGADPVMGQIYNNPTFRRAYLRAFKEIAYGPMLNANVDPVLDAKYAAFVNSGINVTSPSAIKSWIATMHNSLLTTLNSEGANAPFAIVSNNGNDFSTNKNLLTLSGTAPIEVKSILINGVVFPVTWTSVSSWTVNVALHGGTNVLAFTGTDLKGNLIPTATGLITVNYTGTTELPQEHLVINEIMYDPVVPNASFVEIYNTSTINAFDLTGWQLRGAGYVFPQGSVIGPDAYLLLAANRAGFNRAYSSSIPVFDTFNTELPLDGGTLSLVNPSTNAAPDLIATRVHYSSSPPWPAGASGTGSSLQLIDPQQDNWRAGNWAVALTNPPPAPPQWQYVTLTGVATKSALLIGMTTAGDVYVDDLKLVAGSVPEVGVNYIQDGDFETDLSGPWTVSSNMSGSAIDATQKHSGGASLHIVATSGGPTISQAIWQNTTTLVTNGTYTLSYWYLPSTNGNSLLIRLSGSSPNSGHIYSLQSFQPPPSVSTIATPGAANSVKATLPAFPTLWLNEVEADNLTGITNSAGQRSPWLELYNPGTNSVSLDGLYLANQYSNLTNWAFPSSALINPGEFKVIFADGQTNLSTLSEFHTGFILPGGTGSLALSRLNNGQPQVLDYLDYSNLPLDHSYGSYPDGQSFDRREFFIPTPGGTNNGAGPLLTISINEWMAGNTRTIFNPIGGKADDWFELYNYGTNAVDPAGYYLTDTLTNRLKFLIPVGYSIAPGGFLLVWADKQTPTGSGDLHVNFHLAKAGTSIGLFGGDGQAVDFVSFGAQVSDVSEGRYPDGAPAIYVMNIPTPQAPNSGPNNPPSLAPLTNVTVYSGQLLNLTATGADVDQPPQILTYSLGAPVPTGASIDPTTGLFSWVPSTAPANITVTIVVTDNGTPQLSASQSFVIKVLTLPNLTTSTSLDGTTLTLSWQTTAGARYQVQYSDDLSANHWTDLGSEQLGTGGILSTVLSVSASTQRFYRLAIR